MHKERYLPELDNSLNNNVDVSLEKMFKVLVIEGDILILSLNQLADSITFMSIINDDRMRKVFHGFFKARRIKVRIYKNSLHKEYFNVLDYVLDNIECCLLQENYNFIFSSVPVLNMPRTKEKMIVYEIVRDALKMNSSQYVEDKTVEYIKEKQLSLLAGDIDMLKKYVEFLISISFADIDYYIVEDKGTTLYDSISKTKEVLREQNNNVLLSCIEVLENNIIDINKKGIESRSEWNTFNKELTALDQRDKMEYLINRCETISIESKLMYKDNYGDSVEEEILDLVEYISSYAFKKNKDITYNYVFDVEKIKVWESSLRIIKRLLLTEKNRTNTTWQISDMYVYCSWTGKIFFMLCSVIFGGLKNFLVTTLAIWIVPNFIDDCFNAASEVSHIKRLLMSMISVIICERLSFWFKIKNIFEIILDKENRDDICLAVKLIKENIRRKNNRYFF